MHATIGAFEAKATLSALLQAIKKGKKFTITVRGEPVADLVPTNTASHSKEAAIQALLAMPKIEGISAEAIKEAIAEGRR